MTSLVFSVWFTNHLFKNPNMEKRKLIFMFFYWKCIACLLDQPKPPQICVVINQSNLFSDTFVVVVHGSKIRQKSLGWDVKHNFKIQNFTMILIFTVLYFAFWTFSYFMHSGATLNRAKNWLQCLFSTQATKYPWILGDPQISSWPAQKIVKPWQSRKWSCMLYFK